MRTPSSLTARRPWAKVSVLALSLLLLLRPLRQVSAAGTETIPLPYVATPGVRDYLEFGVHGILVFDIDPGDRFLKRIPSAGLDTNGRPMNVKGICAHAG